MEVTEAVRWRKKTDKEVTEPVDHVVQQRRKRQARFRLEWDLVFWMFGSFAMLYFTDFASHLVFNTAVRRWWLCGSVLLFVVCIGCLVHAMRTHPTLSTKNWNEEAPVLIAMATGSILTAAISLSVAIWPVWKLYTLLMVPTLFMGFISTVSLFNL